ncbi:alpha/beta hydrolase [Staphylococcus aureus]|uniref:Alpha/beta hydrolase n=1 Tax=Staphylococcus aureus TaxID=1280 RepID=A0A380EMG6_STAAU|nr:hypothetical protein DP18_2153 [Staphylococcus aureus]SUL37452.1 alpha/beta hydrolase [Staphylococcus aureus]SUL56370.1 alpha/beta hydrolase [Staphylococcus aureus]
MKKIFVIITTLLAVAIIIGSIIMVVFSQRQAQTFKIQQQQFVKKQFQHCSYMDLVVVPILKSLW